MTRRGASGAWDTFSDVTIATSTGSMQFSSVAVGGVPFSPP
jgi:hypothetical protein